MTFDLTFELRLIIVALSAFTAVTFAGSGVVAIMWRRRSSRNPAARASSLLRWRLAPTTAAVTATLLASAAFVVFEQRGLEDTGLLLQFLAAITPVLVAAAAWRAWRIHRTTRRTLSEWMATAEQIVLPGISRPAVVVRAAFPVVAIVGVFRPRLVIAKSVVDACSPEEIEAILAHEQRHIDWHDNLRRAFFWTAPDVFAWLPISQQMLYAWHDATEEAADEEAARLGPHGSLNLAQALIRVARIARMTSDGCDLPASALFRGEDLDARVRRLISSPSVGPPRRRLSGIQGIALALLATVVAVTALGGVHELIELAVTVLP